MKNISQCAPTALLIEKTDALYTQYLGGKSFIRPVPIEITLAHAALLLPDVAFQRLNARGYLICHSSPSLTSPSV